MGQQLVQCRRLAGFGLIRRCRAVDQAAHIGESGDEIRHRRIKVEQPAFRQHHDADRGDGLGHRIDAGDRVACERLASIRVALALGIKVDLLPALRHQHRTSGKPFAVHIGLHPVPDAAQLICVERQKTFLPSRDRASGG